MSLHETLLDPTAQLARYLSEFGYHAPVPKPALKEVRRWLKAGADPNAMVYMYPTGSADLAAVSTCLAVPGATLADRVDLPPPLFPAVSLLQRMVLAVDRGLFDAIRERSVVPVDPQAVVTCMAGTTGALTWTGNLLLWAMVLSKRKLEAVRLALELGCDPNSTYIAHGGRLAGRVVRPVSHLLMNYDVCANVVPDEAEAILRLLVDKGVDLNAVNGNGHMFLSACAATPVEADVDTGEKHALVGERLLKTALELGADPALPVAAPSPPYNVATSAMMALLRLTPEPGNKPRIRENRAIRVLEILKASGMDMRPEADTVLVPVETEAGLRNQGLNSLCLAIVSNSGPVVKWILDNSGLNVNAHLDAPSPSYLFQSAVSAVCTKLLLEAGADPTITNNMGQTAAAVARVTSKDPDLLEQDWACAADVAELLEQAEARWRASH